MKHLEQRLSLIAHALQVRERAYAPYSNFAVGAALLSQRGEIYCGCNVENASYGLTQCAERTAVCNSLSHGCCNWVALAVAAPQSAPPCGACRQVLAEFVTDVELRLLLVDADSPDRVLETTLTHLFPQPFRG